MGPFGEEKALSRHMVKSWFDFGRCTSKNCDVGGLNSSRWPEFTTLPQGARITFTTPVSGLHAVDDSTKDKKCAFFEDVVASKHNPTTLVMPTKPWKYDSTPANSVFDYVFYVLNTLSTVI
jgi:hypothetical protein